MARKIYKTMRGKEVDLEAIRSKNELTIAVGNAQMNARGDRVGKGGQIVKTRENTVADYYENTPTSAPQPNIDNQVKKKV